MCGFAGYSGEIQNIPDIQSTLINMGTSLRHRGPDDSGIWMNQNMGVGIVHRRLSIIDLSAAGGQPMISESGRYVLAFNGEIYNYQEIRKQLQKRGVVFRGESDTEVFLANIDAYGIEASLQTFAGMFAFVLLDLKEKTLSLVRDRMGEKPLYYGWQGNVLLFGSELKALRHYPKWQPDINNDAIASLVKYGYIPCPQTIYSGFYKLPPGHIFTTKCGVASREHTIKPWWSLTNVVGHDTNMGCGSNSSDVLATFDNLFNEIIQQHKIADVPLGALLSGGIDSTFVLAYLQKNSSQPISTFTIGYSESEYDESEYARKVANYFGTKHHEWIVTPEDARNVIPDIPMHYDEPFADSSQIPTILVARMASKDVTVALSGDGGDESFGGYNRYTWGGSINSYLYKCPMHLRHIIAGLMKLPTDKFWNKLFFYTRFGLKPRWHLMTPVDKIQKLALAITATNDKELYEMFISSWQGDTPLLSGAALDIIEENKDLWNERGEFSERMMRVDSVTYLPDDILTKVDRASMAYSLEVRAPFLDYRIVEFANKLPLRFKIQKGKGKWIIREQLKQYVPPELTDRPKSGFAIPLSEWLRGPLKEWAGDLLTSNELRENEIFSETMLQEKWEEHQSGRRNNLALLWSVLMFQAWLTNS